MGLERSQGAQRCIFLGMLAHDEAGGPAFQENLAVENVLRDNITFPQFLSSSQLDMKQDTPEFT